MSAQGVLAQPLAGENWQQEVLLPDVEGTAAFARELAQHLRPGDLLVLSGGLGAGKTTFTQALGEALEVQGQVSSPTFVLARIHRSQTDGPNLVHVDAYRTDAPGLESLDLAATLSESVTVVEWGRGLVELALVGPEGSWLDLQLEAEVSPPAGPAPIRTDFSETDEDIEGSQRRAVLRGYGPRWAAPVHPKPGK